MAIMKELQKELSEYCLQSTIHGMSNVGNTNRSFHFRLIWLLIMVVAFILAGVSIKKSIDGNFLQTKTLFPFLKKAFITFHVRNKEIYLFNSMGLIH
jgi:hypothetical protein